MTPPPHPDTTSTPSTYYNPVLAPSLPQFTTIYILQPNSHPIPAPCKKHLHTPTQSPSHPCLSTKPFAYSNQVPTLCLPHFKTICILQPSPHPMPAVPQYHLHTPTKSPSLNGHNTIHMVQPYSNFSPQGTHTIYMLQPSPNPIPKWPQHHSHALTLPHFNTIHMLQPCPHAISALPQHHLRTPILFLSHPCMALTPSTCSNPIPNSSVQGTYTIHRPQQCLCMVSTLSK